MILRSEEFLLQITNPSSSNLTTKSLGLTMNNIVASFSCDTAFNEYYVYSFVCRNASK